MAVCVLLVAQAQAQQPASSEAAKLPVRRVVLFKNGVGYFEHVGRVRGNREVTIDFTTGQLNDVLKSLTVLDLGEGRITGVSYNSEAPFERRLGALRLPVGEKTNLIEFLGALRGARIEVRSGTSVVAGALLSIERKTRISGGTTLEVDYLSLVTDAGEVRSLEVTPATSVRLLERELSEQVRRYLGLVASTRDRDLRRMTISAAGQGERPLFVSYISEVPVWKTTYRIVLPSKSAQKPLLQGWAIVDNTVGEDWENVELSLVAGAPQSFVLQLSQPYYQRRPVVALPESAMLTPQTHQATLLGGAQLAGTVTDPTGAIISGATVRVRDENGNMLAQTQTDETGEYWFESLPVGTHRLEFEMTGFNKTVVNQFRAAAGLNQFNTILHVGSVSSVVEVSESISEINVSATTVSRRRTAGSGGQLGSGSQLRERRGAGSGGGVGSGSGGGFAGGVLGGLPAEARSRLEAEARAQELGDLFEYKLKERITIRKNQSALVPIVQTQIAAEKVSLWNASGGSARPQRALWLTNSSHLTLDGGTFSVLEDETFAGEGLIEPVKPGERRLVSFAVDLSMLASVQQESEPRRITRVRIARGVMIHSSEMRETRTYTVRNEDTSPRTLIIEHPVRPGWKLVSDAKPDETTPSWLRFRVSVPAKQSAKLAVTEARPQESTFQVSNVSDEQIALFLRQKSITPEVEAALRRILEQKNRVAALQAEKEQADEQMSGIYDDQERLRENMKALKGSAEEKALLQRYTRQLDEQENRLDALKKEITELEARRAAAQAELDKMIQGLALDVALT
jgi:hypothetical protein